MTSIRLGDAWDGDAVGYDAWKPRSPDDEYPEECLHEDYEADINGRAICCQCGHAWYLTDDEIKLERELHVAYDAMMRREERRERIAALVRWLTFWRRWRKPTPIDDDIPF
jgi:hypothetical protein